MQSEGIGTRSRAHTLCPEFILDRDVWTLKLLSLDQMKSKQQPTHKQPQQQTAPPPQRAARRTQR